jgi:fatty acid/phospholipid biosynthesis enzyme
LRIGFDLMGSDSAPKNELEALQLLKLEPVCDLVISGKGDYEHDVADFGFDFRVADELIGMHEIPSVAIRQKRNSSLSVLLQLLKNKEQLLKLEKLQL